MGWPPVQNLIQRAGTPNETEKELDQDTHHIVQSLHVPEEGEESSGETETRITNEASVTMNEVEEFRERVKWPKTIERKHWQVFDEEVDSVLEATLPGIINKKMKAMTTIMYSVGYEKLT